MVQGENVKILSIAEDGTSPRGMHRNDDVSGSKSSGRKATEETGEIGPSQKIELMPLRELRKRMQLQEVPLECMKKPFPLYVPLFNLRTAKVLTLFLIRNWPWNKIQSHCLTFSSNATSKHTICPGKNITHRS